MFISKIKTIYDWANNHRVDRNMAMAIAYLYWLNDVGMILGTSRMQEIIICSGHALLLLAFLISAAFMVDKLYTKRRLYILLLPLIMTLIFFVLPLFATSVEYILSSTYLRDYYLRANNDSFFQYLIKTNELRYTFAIYAGILPYTIQSAIYYWRKPSK